LEVVKTICDFKGVGLDSENKDGKTALHVAALKNRIEVVKFLVKKGAKVDIRDNRKRTAFLDAARHWYTEIVKILKENGADVNQVTGRNRWSALHLAAEKDILETVKYLVKPGAEKSLKIKSGSEEGMTAREIVEEAGSRKALEFLT
jgi:ankyrin repeat protein